MIERNKQSSLYHTQSQSNHCLHFFKLTVENHWSKHSLLLNYNSMKLKLQKQTKRPQLSEWKCESSNISLSSSVHTVFRSIWNLAKRLRWSEGNMSLGRPFIDHKTSSDKRERDPISSKPSLTKPPAAEEKRQKEVIKVAKCISELTLSPLLNVHTVLISGYDASWGVENVVNSSSHFRVQGCDFWTARAWKNVVVDGFQV